MRRSGLRFLNWYYNLFQFENGDNTCIAFTVSTLITVGIIVVELIARKKGKSIFF